MVKKTIHELTAKSEERDVIMEPERSDKTTHRVRVSDITEFWYGAKQDMSEVKKYPLALFENIENKDILIISCQFRSGKTKAGKDFEYIYTVFIDNFDTDNEVRKVTFLKGETLIRKLRLIAEQGKLPIVAKCSLVQGKNNKYYDIL